MGVTANDLTLHRVRRFKSSRLRHADPQGSVRRFFGIGTTEHAPVAQRIEHLTTDQEVRGSNPFGRTEEEAPGCSDAVRGFFDDIGVEPGSTALVGVRRECAEFTVSDPMSWNSEQWCERDCRAFSHSPRLHLGRETLHPVDGERPRQCCSTRSRTRSIGLRSGQCLLRARDSCPPRRTHPPRRARRSVRRHQ